MTLAGDSTPIVQRIGQCERKRSYPNEAAGWSAIFAIRARGGATDRLAPYGCEYCHRWHLGRPPTTMRTTMPPTARQLRAALPYKDDD